MARRQAQSLECGRAIQAEGHQVSLASAHFRIDRLRDDAREPRELKATVNGRVARPVRGQRGPAQSCLLRRPLEGARACRAVFIGNQNK